MGQREDRFTQLTQPAGCTLQPAFPPCLEPLFPGWAFFWEYNHPSTPTGLLTKDYIQFSGILGYILEPLSCVLDKRKRETNFCMNLLYSFWVYWFLLRGVRKWITRCMPSQTICWIFKNWTPSWKKLHIQSLLKGNFIWLDRILISVCYMASLLKSLQSKYQQSLKYVLKE